MLELLKGIDPSAPDGREGDVQNAGNAFEGAVFQVPQAHNLLKLGGQFLQRFQEFVGLIDRRDLLIGSRFLVDQFAAR